MLGIFNFVSISELILKGRVLYEPLTGEIVVTDSATANTITAATMPFAADGRKLRHVLSQSILVTATCRASGIVPALALSSRQAYSEFSLNTRRDQMKDRLDVVEACGLLTRERKKDHLAKQDFGETMFHIEAR